MDPKNTTRKKQHDYGDESKDCGEQQATAITDTDKETSKTSGIAPVQYAYLDHTADVQLHAWASNFEEAIQQLVIALFGYMTTDISCIEPVYTMDFEVNGHDLQSLIYNILDACLYNFCAEPFFIGCIARVLRLNRPKNEATEDGDGFSIHLRVWGESFDRQKHPTGTEVKAITYSNMQIMEKQEEENNKNNSRTDLFVIVDI